MSTTVLHGKVIALLNAARLNNVQVGDDMIYMPYPKTTLKEATTHLRKFDYILIEGGRIEYVLRNFILAVRGGQGADVITWQEVRHLLKANYPSAPKRTPIVKETHDTIPCPPPTVLPTSGYVLIRPTNTVNHPGWEPNLLDANLLTGQERYRGERTINGLPMHVWYSDDLVDGVGGFLAQPTCLHEGLQTLSEEEDNLPFDLSRRLQEASELR